MAKTFRGGVHPHDFKELSKDKSIKPAPVPEVVVLPMSQHIGAPCKPVVKKRDEVKKGQLIGEAGGFVSAPIHASVSGKVTAVEPRPHPLGRPTLSVVIENDGNEEWAEGLNEERDYSSMSPDEMREEIQKAGMVGMGGATFPTHVKLSPPKDKPIDAVILNGAECEPYLTCDYRLMLEKPTELVEGLKIIMGVLSVTNGYIGIEANKPDAFARLKQAVAGEPNVSVELLEVKYPQGAEKQLIKALLDRDVPPPSSAKPGGPMGLPMDVGVVVQNVGTALAIYEALKYDRPIVERVLTITGDGVRERSNLLARLGTPLKVLLDDAGPLQDLNKLIMGGPMMGLAQFTDDVPVIKGTSGILALCSAETFEYGACIRCGKCVRNCPMNLVPSDLSIICESKNIEAIKSSQVMDCFECGCCTFGCPAKRPIVHLVKFGKAELAKLAKK